MITQQENINNVNGTLYYTIYFEKQSIKQLTIDEYLEISRKIDELIEEKIK